MGDITDPCQIVGSFWCRQSSELRICVKVEVDVLDSPSLIVLIVSVDVKQH